jgi:hypothetical protein
MSGRLSTRDYKTPRRGGMDLAHWQQFGYGLGIGLLIALLVWIADHRSAARAPEEKPEPRRSGGSRQQRRQQQLRFLPDAA